MALCPNAEFLVDGDGIRLGAVSDEAYVENAARRYCIVDEVGGLSPGAVKIWAASTGSKR